MEKTKAKTSDYLGRYYTADFVSQILVTNIYNKIPSKIIDLGAGDGSLINAAATRWQNAEYITVDIDKSVNAQCLQRQVIKKHTHHNLDALDAHLSEKIGIPWGSIDLALCNPPYITQSWKKHFAEILEEAGFSGAIPKLKEIPFDLLFIAQNLRLLRPGGSLGLIIPDGIISGERFTSVRRHLLNHHQVERVIELPRRVFEKTDAKAHILLISKHGKNQDRIPIQQLDLAGNLSPELLIDKKAAAKRMDYSYNSVASHHSNIQFKTINDLTTLITRGQISSVERSLLDIPVFHITDFPIASHYINGSEIHITTPIQGLKLAETGDILIARVGKNLSNKVCMVKQGKVVISDCIILLRSPPEIRNFLLKFLTSDEGKRQLKASARGVAAQFLTHQAILDIPVQIWI